MATSAYPIIGLYVSIILIGYIFKRLSILRIEDSKSLINIILNFTLPAVVLRTFYKAPLDGSMLYVFIISIIFNIVMSGIGVLVFRKTASKRIKGLLIISCAGFNIGLFAYPFVQAIWGKSGLLYMAIFDLGNALVVFGSSYILAIFYSPSRHRIDYRIIIKRLATFPPFMVYIAGIILAFFPVTYPASILRFLDIVAGANSVLVLLVIGMFMSFSISKSVYERVASVLILRYSLGIVTALLIGWLLPVSNDVKQILMLGLILPIGMSIIPYSVLFGYDKTLAGVLVNFSNLASFILMVLAVLFCFN